ncbi:MAG: GH1 family beta-glucosidase [Gaiellales bacterium]
MRDERFPRSFSWGAATSAYQVEGAVREGGRGVSIWDRFCDVPGKVLNADNGAVACDFYHRYPDDIRLMQELGIDSFRFSVAWPRVLPTGTGPVNQPGLDFYDRLVEALLEAGIEPCVTLYHWDLPIELQDRGGWPSRELIGPFTDYAEVVAGRLGDRVKRWITHNEPWVVAWLGYGNGEHAPGLESRKLALAASHTLLVSHGHAVEVLRNLSPDSEVGITLNLQPVYAAGDTEGDLAAVAYVDGYFNRWYLDPLYRGEYPADMLELYGADAPEVRDGDFARITVPTDYLGINYYSRHLVGQGTSPTSPRYLREPASDYTAMDWEVYPRGLTDLLVRLHRDYAPPALQVTENGAAYDDPEPAGGFVEDPERVAYFASHVAALGDAIEECVPVTAYYAWSLLDNFEWAFGYERRFGIVHVDFETLERTPKASFRFLRDLLAAQRG